MGDTTATTAMGMVAMSDAPKRIWTYSDGLWIEAWDAPPSGAEYIRADLMAELVEALRWYGEVGRLARLITREGDAGRAAISADGGQRAAAALAKIKEPKT